MAKLSFLLAIAVLAGSNAMAEDEPVKIRSDGQIIDGMGKIIAVPDMKDSRNTEYKIYYRSLDANGKPQSAADFYIMADPNNGYIKKPINEVVQEAVATQPPEPVVQQNGFVRKYDGSITLRKGIDVPVYDNTPNRTVY